MIGETGSEAEVMGPYLGRQCGPGFRVRRTGWMLVLPLFALGLGAGLSGVFGLQFPCLKTRVIMPTARSYRTSRM